MKSTSGIAKDTLFRAKLKNDLRENKEKIKIERKSPLRGQFTYEIDGMILMAKFNFYSIQSSHVHYLNCISLDDKTGFHFLQFFEDLVQEKESNFLITKNLEVYDIRKNILDIKEIIFQNCMIDDLTIKLLRRFSKLEKISFYHCFIKTECNFNQLGSIFVYINQSEVESFKVFQNSKINLEFLHSNILEISTGNFIGEKLKINDTKIDVEKLFLTWNFSNLKSFSFYDEYLRFKHKYQFKYLKYSAPYLENLFLECEVASFEFLFGMSHIIDLHLLNSFDDLGLASPKTNDKSELEKLKNKYKELLIEKQDLIDEEKLLSYLAYVDFLNTCNLYRKLSYTKEEKFALFKSQQRNFNDYVQTKQFPNYQDGYYKATGNVVRFHKFEIPSFDIWRPNNVVGMMDDFMYEQTTDSKIVRGIPYIYYIDGHPMELVYQKPISINQVIQVNKKEEIDDFEFMIQDISKLSTMKQMSFSLLQDIICDEFGVSIYQIDFLKQLREKLIESNEDCNYIVKYIDNNIQKRTKMKQIENQIEKKYWELIDLLLENYNQFTKQEKIYLLVHLKLYGEISNYQNPLSEQWISYISDITDSSIDKKTKDKYSLLNREMKELKNKKNQLEFDSDEMELEDIKKLKYLKYIKKENI